MISTISERATTSSMKACGMRPAMERLRSTAELDFDFRADGGHVGSVLRLALDDGHDFTHILDARGAGCGDGIVDQGVDLGVAHWGWPVALQQGKFPRLLLHQVRPIAGLE